MSKQRESDQARRFYQRAQASLGADAYRRTLTRVQSTSATQFLKNPVGWVAGWHRDIEEARRKSRRLGQSYYRLERAIWLDETVDDGHRYGATTTKGQLWNELYASGGSEKRKPEGKPIATSTTSPWAPYDKKESIRQASKAFHFKGERRLKRAEEEIRQKQELTLDSLDDLDQLLDSIGTNLAGEAQKIAEDGARDAIGEAVDKDPGAIAYMRVTDGNACYFCVMLASRGAVYRNKKSAGDAEVRQYHPNCGCTATPIFDRKYEYPKEVKDAVALWKEHWNGSMKDWRKAIEELNKKNR